MINTISSRTVLARRVAAACGTGVLLLGAAACGSSDPAPAASNGGTYDGGQPNGTAQQGQRPGASGRVAAVSGSTAQVQSQDSGQVAVSWTASTAFTKQVAAKLADIKAGDCVMVAPVQSNASSGTDPGTQPTAITAATVRITEKVDGSCTPARGAGPGVGQNGGPQLQGGPPEGALPGGAAPGGAAPGGAAPDGSRPQLRGFGGAFGTVKSVSATGFVVTTTTPTAADPTKTESVDVTVTVARATTYTTTAHGAASDVKVGACVNADGRTDATGAVTAIRIAVTLPVDGECTGGMVRFSRGSADSGTSAS